MEQGLCDKEATVGNVSECIMISKFKYFEQNNNEMHLRVILVKIIEKIKGGSLKLKSKN